jgi:hypothetical protein
MREVPAAAPPACVRAAHDARGVGGAQNEKVHAHDFALVRRTMDCVLKSMTFVGRRRTAKHTCGREARACGYGGFDATAA